MSLTFSHILYRYTRAAKPVFTDFCWQVSPGKTVLLGPNGAGKSTLLALGANALRPNRGDITLGLLSATTRSHRAAYRRAVGWMPQQIRAVPGLTAQEQVAYAAWLKGYGRKQAWSAAAAALDQVGLTPLAASKTATLSGGQLRRVGLAQVIVHAPEVLLLDEPTVGLDPAQRSRFRTLLAELPATQPVIVSTHQIDDLSELFDTVVVLVAGTIRFAGSVTEFMRLAPADAATRRAEVAYAQFVGEEH